VLILAVSVLVAEHIGRRMRLVTTNTDRYTDITELVLTYCR